MIFITVLINDNKNIKAITVLLLPIYFINFLIVSDGFLSLIFSKRLPGPPGLPGICILNSFELANFNHILTKL